MKVTTLACDYCTAVVPAVASRSLSNGKPRRGDPTVDLCQRHLAELVRAFQPKPSRMGRPKRAPGPKLDAIEAKRAADRDRHRRKREELAASQPKGPRKKRHSSIPWAERQAMVLALLPSVGSIGARELQERVVKAGKLPFGAYKEVVRRLRADGSVTMKGGRSRAVYTRATERAAAHA